MSQIMTYKLSKSDVFVLQKHKLPIYLVIGKAKGHPF